MSTVTPMQALYDISTTMVEKCLPLIKQNYAIIAESDVLCADFRANMGNWMVIATERDLEDNPKDTDPTQLSKDKLLPFIFLANDGVIQGTVNLHPKDGKINYDLRVLPPAALHTPTFHECKTILERFPSHPSHPTKQP